MSDKAGEIGNALQNLPVREMLRDLAVGISEAQQALDEKSIAVLLSRSKQKSGIKDGDEDKTLLELGLIPSFYQFREATIDLSFALSMHMESSTAVSANLNIDFSN